jgi:hypothetical protein
VATGAGVEQPFNSAWDICHYHRGSLKATTIQGLMMFMCTSRFEIEEEQLALIDEYLTNEEIHAANEEKDAHDAQEDLDLISDDEEDVLVANCVLIFEQGLSQRAQGKRRKSVASEAENEEPYELAHLNAYVRKTETS